MSVWDELTGQPDAIALFKAAARDAHDSAPSSVAQRDPAAGAMTHSWLITGPPGSGRSNLAFAFATALLSGEIDGDEVTARQVQARTHPDLGVLSTELVTIKIDDVRALVRSSNYSPSVARYRVMIIEDADRMREHASNVLLKALEEPPPRTVWILCAPSEADLIATIRSRVRSVRLRVPSVADVATLLVRRDGVDQATAHSAALQSQSHIGMAHRLATNPDARERRATTLQLALGVGSTSDAVVAAAKLLELAAADAKAITTERDADERESALRSLGVAPGGTIPAALRSQLRGLDEDQKRRATRSLRDGLDRIMIDLLSLYRDILLIQMGVGGAGGQHLVNDSIRSQIERAGELGTAQITLATMDAISLARQRIEGNVAPTLALEAMLVTAVRRGASS